VPRKAKTTQTGQRAQAPSMIPGQTYGKQVAQAQLQTSMPAPNVQGAAAPPPAAPAQPPDQPMPSNRQIDPTAIAKAMQAQDPLLGMTQRPNEPFTAGLSTGPGPGPEAIQGITMSPLGDTLRALSDQLGDPMFRDLAQRSRL
jgi:hypothetical protein